MTHIVGQSYSERFFGRLSLVIIEIFLVLGVVRSRLVGWLGNYKRIACGVHGASLVSSCYARWIRLRPIVSNKGQ